MLIDFHTHCFPDALAPKAIPKLASLGGIQNVTDGTVGDTLRKMDAWGVDRSVVCNIATNPHQTPKVNDFAIYTDQTVPRLTALGSVHPGCEPSFIRAELRRLKEAGIRGIKIHPDYMETMVDDPAFDPIYRTCCELDLFVITHAGYDFYSPSFMHAPPAAIARVLARYPDLRLAAAHLGGYAHWDDVRRLLCGRRIWLDTSLLCSPDADRELGRRVILEHDPDRLLFGSDCPWCTAADATAALDSLGLDDELMEKIRHKNAERLLGEIR